MLPIKYLNSNSTTTTTSKMEDILWKEAPPSGVEYDNLTILFSSVQSHLKRNQLLAAQCVLICFSSNNCAKELLWVPVWMRSPGLTPELRRILCVLPTGEMSGNSVAKGGGVSKSRTKRNLMDQSCCLRGTVASDHFMVTRGGSKAIDWRRLCCECPKTRILFCTDVNCVLWILPGRGRSWITGPAGISGLGRNSEPHGNNRSLPETRERVWCGPAHDSVQGSYVKPAYLLAGLCHEKVADCGDVSQHTLLSLCTEWKHIMFYKLP